MCLIADKLFLFLSLLSPEIVEIGPTTAIVRAHEGTIVWERAAAGNEWCTQEPATA